VAWENNHEACSPACEGGVVGSIAGLDEDKLPLRVAGEICLRSRSSVDHEGGFFMTGPAVVEILHRYGKQLPQLSSVEFPKFNDYRLEAGRLLWA
jgi:hypothetical protein